MASRGRACVVVLVPGGHGIGRGLRTHIRSSGTGGACGSRVAAPGGSRSGGILDLGGQRLRPPRSIVGTRGVVFRPGQPVRGLAGVRWDTARSGPGGRRNPGRTVRRQTGLRADGGFAQGRRAQDWAGSLEDREDPGGTGSFHRSVARWTPWYQHRFGTGCSSGMPVSARPARAIARRGADALQPTDEGGQEIGGCPRRCAVRGPDTAGKSEVYLRADLHLCQFALYPPVRTAAQAGRRRAVRPGMPGQSSVDVRLPKPGHLRRTTRSPRTSVRYVSRRFGRRSVRRPGPRPS